MTTLSTHDTKRSDDVRARLAVLSEVPEEFRDALMRWSRRNNELRAELRLGDYPDRNTEYLFYQTLIGAWPISVARAREYMLKAAREAKQHTSWTQPNAEFEDSLARFIDTVLGDRGFVTDLEQFVDRVKDAGRINSLAQTLMKYTSPGVPDLYQGSELWDLSLVDPDNRRPIDYALRARLLGEIRNLPPQRAAAEAMRRAEEGLPKLWTIHRALQLRRERAQSFGADGAYTPSQSASGRPEGRVTRHRAFSRGGDVATGCSAPDHCAGRRLGRHGARSFAAGRVDQPSCTGASLGGGKVAIEELLREFPVALLARN